MRKQNAQFKGEWSHYDATQGRKIIFFSSAKFLASLKIVFSAAAKFLASLKIIFFALLSF